MLPGVQLLLETILSEFSVLMLQVLTGSFFPPHMMCFKSEMSSKNKLCEKPVGNDPFLAVFSLVSLQKIAELSK